MRQEVEKWKGRQVNPLFSKYEALVKENSNLIKAKTLIEYQVKQQDKDYKELEEKHNNLVIDKKLLEEELEETTKERNQYRERSLQLEEDIEKLKFQFNTSLNNYHNSLVLLKSS